MRRSSLRIQEKAVPIGAWRKRGREKEIRGQKERGSGEREQIGRGEREQRGKERCERERFS